MCWQKSQTGGQKKKNKKLETKERTEPNIKHKRRKIKSLPIQKKNKIFKKKKNKTKTAIRDDSGVKHNNEDKNNQENKHLKSNNQDTNNKDNDNKNSDNKDSDNKDSKEKDRDNLAQISLIGLRTLKCRTEHLMDWKSLMLHSQSWQEYDKILTLTLHNVLNKSNKKLIREELFDIITNKLSNSNTTIHNIESVDSVHSVNSVDSVDGVNIDSVDSIDSVESTDSVDILNHEKIVKHLTQCVTNKILPFHENCNYTVIVSCTYLHKYMYKTIKNTQVFKGFEYAISAELKELLVVLFITCIEQAVQWANMSKLSFPKALFALNRYRHQLKPEVSELIDRMNRVFMCLQFFIRMDRYRKGTHLSFFDFLLKPSEKTTIKKLIQFKNNRNINQENDPRYDICVIQLYFIQKSIRGLFFPITKKNLKVKLGDSCPYSCPYSCFSISHATQEDTRDPIFKNKNSPHLMLL